MSRKQNALERRFQGKDLKPWEKEKPPGWKEEQKRLFEKTRNCTIKDIKEFVSQRKEMMFHGYWLYVGNYFETNWERQIHELYIKSNAGTWEEIEENMITKWKAKYTKLGRVLA